MTSRSSHAFELFCVPVSLRSPRFVVIADDAPNRLTILRSDKAGTVATVPRGRTWLGLAGSALAVADDLDLLGGHQRAPHHAFDRINEFVDRVLAVDDLDDERQVPRQAQDLGRVQMAGMAETHGSAQHGGAGKVHLARLEVDLPMPISRDAVLLCQLQSTDRLPSIVPLIRAT